MTRSGARFHVPADLSVTGIPDIGTPSTVLDFQTVRLGLPETRIATITNFGTDVLTVDSVTIPHPEFSANRTAFDLNPLESTAIAVTLDPVTTGAKDSVMTVTSDDPNRPVLEIRLTGTGIIAAKLAVNPGALQEEQFVGQMSTQTLSLNNEGGELLIYSMTLDQISAATIPPEIDLVRDDFESGPNGWTTVSYAMEDLWHLTDVDANSPTHSWWCSQPGFRPLRHAVRDQQRGDQPADRPSRSEDAHRAELLRGLRDRDRMG